MPELDVFKKRKPKDCGCSGMPGEDGDYTAELIEAFAQLVEDAEPDLAPDPRGNTVRRWSGLIAPYGLPTGDGRRFATDALSSRDLPLPVKWQRTDSQGHSTSVTVGRIDGVDYTSDGVSAWGIIFDPDAVKLPRLAEDANEAYELLQKKVIGPSVDLDEMDFHELEPAGEYAADAKREIEVTRGRISAITLVQIPAFAEARPFALDDLDADEYAEMTAVTAAGVAQGMAELTAVDLPWEPVEWLLDEAHQHATALYSRGDVALFPVAKVVDGHLNLVTGAVADAVSMLAHHAEDVQLGEGTKQALRQELEALTAAVGLPSPPWARAALTAAAGIVEAAPPAELFERPKFDGPTPITVRKVVDPSGVEHLHYAGHVATWGVCHIGFPGQCVTAPKSRASYAYFHTGSTETAKGRIPTGKVTLGGGHADVRKGFQAAVQHYDDAGAAVADVRAYEDEHGIAVSGVVRPGVDARRLAELAAAPLSGDWRRIGGGLEMVAALAVNTPGFPVINMAKHGGETFALVAAGTLAPPETVAEIGATPDVQALVQAEFARSRRARKAAAMFATEEAETARLNARERAFKAARVFV